MSTYSKHSDGDLMIGIREGDELAFNEIYNRYKGLLLSHALRMLSDTEEAKDVVQDLFTSLWTKRHDINLSGSLSGYLYTAMRNRILDQIAKEKNRDKYINSLTDFINSGEYITDNQVREKELSLIIEQEVELLPSKMRQIFKLSRDENLSYRDIATELNLSDKTVKKQVSNALTILKKKLDVAFLLGLFFFS